MALELFALVAQYLCGLMAGCLELLGQRSSAVRRTTTGAIGTTTGRPTTRLLYGVDFISYGHGCAVEIIPYALSLLRVQYLQVAQLVGDSPCSVLPAKDVHDVSDAGGCVP